MSKPFIARGEFQEAGTRFALQNDRAQFDVDMGLGKTIMILNAIDVLIRLGETAPTLVMAPKRVAQSTWGDEVKKWDHLSYLKVVPILGTPKERIAALNTRADIYCVNYENLPWLVEHLDGEWPFKTMVADESTKLKSHRAHYRATKNGPSLVCSGGARTTAIARLAFKKTKRFWNLTGTPAPNGLLDLWGSYWFIDAGERLGKSYTAFEQKWFRTGFNGYSIEPLPNAEVEIREAIRDVTFALRAEDYLELGEEIVNTIYVDLPDKARRLYDEMEKEFYIQIEAGEVEAFNAAAKSAKCHQIANGAVYYEDKGEWEYIHDAKIEALQDIIEEAAGMPVVVVYNFRSDLVRLKKAFPKGKALNDSSKVEQDFKDGKLPILFLHPASAGHGIDGFQNVTNIMAFFSLDWNYELHAQVIARIGKVRQFQAGLDRPVFLHLLAARGTVDEVILKRLETKCSTEEALKFGLARRGLK